MSKNTYPGNPRRKEVTSNPNLSSEEKKTTVTIPNDLDVVRIHTDIPTHIRWVLSIEDSDLQSVRFTGDKVCGVTADLPKGYLKLQGSNRKSQTNGSMVTYGDLA